MRAGGAVWLSKGGGHGGGGGGICGRRGKRCGGPFGGGC